MEKNIIKFFELTEEWQTEAKRNLNDLAEETYYLEPDESANPHEHILWDLNECMIAEGNHEGFNYNAVIGISNNSAMLLDIDDNFEIAVIKFI